MIVSAALLLLLFPPPLYIQIYHSLKCPIPFYLIIACLNLENQTSVYVRNYFFFFLVTMMIWATKVITHKQDFVL